MDVRLLFPNQYLGAADLRGRPWDFTIRELRVEELKTNRGTEQKPILFFEECLEAARKRGAPKDEKRLVLNKTNARSIAEMHGWEADRWKGKRISLYPTQCEAFGETVDCIRVQAALNGSAPEPATFEEKEPEPEPERAREKEEVPF